MNILTIFTILFIHWLADFVGQTDAQARGKSTSMFFLISHTISYTSIWLCSGLLYAIAVNNPDIFVLTLIFCIITFLVHTIQDYFISRLNSWLWKKGDVHNFFVSVGFGQWLHYIQLFTTYWWLSKQL